MTELEVLWLRTLQAVVDRAAHEIKDSLNGVSLNLEVVRSRTRKAGVGATDLAEFAGAAASQFETLSERTEALLFLSRPPKPGGEADVATTLRHLATLLVPAARADRWEMRVSWSESPALTTAPSAAVRLGLAAGLLRLAEKGGSCTLDTTFGAVVRFSHESAEACSVDSAIAASLAEQNIVIQRVARGGNTGDLLMAFPGS